MAKDIDLQLYADALKADVAVNARVVHHEWLRAVRSRGKVDDMRKYMEFAAKMLEPKVEKDLANLPVFNFVFNSANGSMQATITPAPAPAALPVLDVPATPVVQPLEEAMVEDAMSEISALLADEDED
jgi:hypothetical protein